MGLALTIGLLDVFVVHADAIQAQGSASAGLDLALGVPLLIIGMLLATGHLHRRQRPHVPAADGQPPEKNGWAQRILHEPRFGYFVVIGALVGTPGAAYITALHSLVNGNSSTAVQVLAVVGFAVIEFALVAIPCYLWPSSPAVAGGAVAWCGAGRRPLAEAPAVPRSSTPTSGRAGPATRTAG